MPKSPRLTAEDAGRMLLKSGYILLRTKGSHRIYSKDEKRIIIPFHSGKTLHPKIVKQVLKAVNY